MSNMPAESSGVSLWSRVRELEGDALRQIQSLYDTNFPIEFRHYFAEIIERQPWDQIDPDQAADESQAKFILDNFLGEINRQCELLSDGGDFLQRLRFSEIGQHFKNVYGNHPMELVRIVKKILSIETRLVQEATAANMNGQDDVKPSTGSEKNGKINKDLEHLYALTQDAESDLRRERRFSGS
ncbi:Oidioi.mRNA.OKI2018_I69.chr2.g7253.t1.cds [Oikopleura dioica]|uniref:Oidioi.mRNA.OKI2018_I69.chr2.g7253.t1.cds n=1 Tax=Oikopleura dioica TaxID=34765 RepID=A0ABN7TAB4_OIKDI|nr:Oidioi.mRNA.OKI2018_I69.chr2.g7253.t1.cds [Oikopleura dioica]